MSTEAQEDYYNALYSNNKIDKEELAQLKENMESEIAANKKYSKRMKGENVLYG